MADLTKPKARQTSFPAVGQTIPRPAAIDTYWRGMFMEMPLAGGNQRKAAGGNLRFSGICQDNKKVTVAGEGVTVLWGMFFWYDSATLAVIANVGKNVTCDDSDTLSIAAANETIVGRIAGFSNGRIFVDATASFAEHRG